MQEAGVSKYALLSYELYEAITPNVVRSFELTIET